MVQNSNFSSLHILPGYPTFSIQRPIPKHVFQENYPVKIKTLGDLIRKSRMDKGLTAKELALEVGANENSVLNWELRNMRPSRKYLKRIYEFFEIENTYMEDFFFKMAFENDKFYSQNPKTFGEKLRAYRMEKFLNAKELAIEISVDPSTVLSWERDQTQATKIFREKIVRLMEKKVPQKTN